MPLLLKLIPWQIYALAALLAAFVLCWALGDWHGRNVTEARYAKATAELRAQIAKQDADHAQKLQSVNSASMAREADLQKRLADALAAPPVVRVVRLPAYPGPGLSCAAPTAQQPQAANPDSGQADRDAAAYRVFRDNLLRFAAQDELTRQAALDAKATW
jgi:hypothetical protein